MGPRAGACHIEMIATAFRLKAAIPAWASLPAWRDPVAKGDRFAIKGAAFVGDGRVVCDPFSV